MTYSRTSYNINGAALADVHALKAHLVKIRPTAVLIMDAFALASELTGLLPNTIVIHRDYAGYGGDDDLIGKPDQPGYRVSPQVWLDIQRQYSDTRVWRYAGNEPGFSDKALRWYTELVEYANLSGSGLKLVVGNWSSGTPASGDSTPIPTLWAKAHKLLEYCNQYRTWLILGLHEYFAGVPTSGFYGGWPSNAGVDPHNTSNRAGLNLIPADLWPHDARGITKFHAGRFEFLLDYCASVHLPPPRIILTEHGADNLSDVKEWLDTLQKTSGYSDIRGWRSLETQWATWYAQKPGWSAQRAYFQMLQYLNDKVYKNTPVEAQLIFTWSSNPDWKSFDVSGAQEFQDLLEIAATTTAEMPKVDPPPETQPPQPIDLPEPTLPPPPDIPASESALQLADVLPEIEAIYAAYGALIARIKAA